MDPAERSSVPGHERFETVLRRRAPVLLGALALFSTAIGCDGVERSPGATIPGGGGSTQGPDTDPGPVPEPVTPDDPGR